MFSGFLIIYRPCRNVFVNGGGVEVCNKKKIYKWAEELFVESTEI